jgi:hypothetical protein
MSSPHPNANSVVASERPQRVIASSENPCCCCGEESVGSMPGIPYTQMCERCLDTVTMLRSMRGQVADHHTLELGERKDL